MHLPLFNFVWLCTAEGVAKTVDKDVHACTLCASKQKVSKGCEQKRRGVVFE